MRLRHPTALGHISEFAALQRLEIVNIQCCKVITGFAATNALPRLRRLTPAECGNIGLDTIEAKMPTLEWANAGATT
ncbi:hypothetical protein MUN78_02990 [Leucobacter allii]|uniref:Uncharacterized protein n=1 Tax=Leucobacter allii TaxID=2932247 RepID=A0ABY4FNM4_9MICO|nr:hypothetical protein [Leucobacter allii]UOQ57819.1 hypothetical protein MUN78_02990 [Leucobacter allii]